MSDNEQNLKELTKEFGNTLTKSLKNNPEPDDIYTTGILKTIQNFTLQVLANSAQTGDTDKTLSAIKAFAAVTNAIKDRTPSKRRERGPEI